MAVKIIRIALIGVLCSLQSLALSAESAEKIHDLPGPWPEYLDDSVVKQQIVYAKRSLLLQHHFSEKIYRSPKVVVFTDVLSEAGPVSSSRPLVGDFNGDGRADLLRHSGVEWTVQLATDSGFELPSMWSPAGIKSFQLVGDFDADGNDDFLQYRVHSGKIAWVVAPSVEYKFNKGRSWLDADALPEPDFAVARDFDGTDHGGGRFSDDLLIYYKDLGWYAYVVDFSDATNPKFSAGKKWTGAGGHLPAFFGDFDGDNRTDFLQYQDTWRWFRSLGNGFSGNRLWNTSHRKNGMLAADLRGLGKDVFLQYRAFSQDREKLNPWRVFTWSTARGKTNLANWSSRPVHPEKDLDENDYPYTKREHLLPGGFVFGGRLNADRYEDILQFRSHAGSVSERSGWLGFYSMPNVPEGSEIVRNRFVQAVRVVHEGRWSPGWWGQGDYGKGVAERYAKAWAGATNDEVWLKGQFDVVPILDDDPDSGSNWTYYISLEKTYHNRGAGTRPMPRETAWRMDAYARLLRSEVFPDMRDIFLQRLADAGRALIDYDNAAWDFQSWGMSPTDSLESEKKVAHAFPRASHRLSDTSLYSKAANVIRLTNEGRYVRSDAHTRNLTYDTSIVCSALCDSYELVVNTDPILAGEMKKLALNTANWLATYYLIGGVYKPEIAVNSNYTGFALWALASAERIERRENFLPAIDAIAWHLVRDGCIEFSENHPCSGFTSGFPGRWLGCQRRDGSWISHDALEGLCVKVKDEDWSAEKIENELPKTGWHDSKMHYHGITLRGLASAYSVTKDTDLRVKLKSSILASINHIIDYNGVPGRLATRLLDAGYVDGNHRDEPGYSKRRGPEPNILHGLTFAHRYIDWRDDNDSKKRL